MKAFYQSPVGVIEIEETNNHISSITILTEQPPNTPSEISPLLNEAIQQFEEYFDGKRKSFGLPIKQEGTDFQRKAWNYLKTIPYGETVSYKDQASAIGSPKAFRAVGSANGRNKLAIIVPCHRVTNEGKGLGGYAYGLDIKRLLLELELFYKEQNNA